MDLALGEGVAHRRALTVPLFAGLLAAPACQEAATVELGADNGVVPIGYAEVLAPLPSPLAPREAPVRVEVAPEADGRTVTVTIRRDAVFLDEETSGLYREVYGEDRISRIRGISLAITELAGAPELAIGDRPVEDGRVSLDRERVEILKDDLLAAREVRLPLAFIHHLALDDLAALGTSLAVRVVVQPTLTVDAF